MSQVGNSFFGIALPWYVFAMTGSKGLLGLTGFVDSLPIVAALFTGVFVERWNKKSTMIVSDVVRSLAALGMFLVTILSALHNVWTLPMLYSLMFILSFMGTFFNPASTAMLPMIIRDDQLKQAMGYSQSAGAFSRLVGTFGGGSLLSLFGAPVLFLVNGISFLVSVFSLGIIHMPKKCPITEGIKIEKRRFWAEWREGLIVIYRNKQILRNQAFALVANFVLGPLEIVTVAWVKGPMDGTGTDLGLVNGCFAVGALISGFCVRFLPKRLHPRWHVFGGCAVMGLCIFLMGLYPKPWYAMVIAFTQSFALGLINATVGGMFIEAIPTHLRARVGGASNALDGLAIPAGLAAFGYIITVLPLPWVYGIIGAFVICSGLSFIPNITSSEAESSQVVSSETRSV